MTTVLGGLKSIDHIVVLVFENRSFDHLLGFLYADSNNRSPLGHPFEGLSGDETNKSAEGRVFQVERLKRSDEYCYFTPHADPGEGFANTSQQLYGDQNVVAQETPPNNEGFVSDYVSALAYERKKGWSIYPEASASGIMKMHTPETLPVLSTLAREYAVCDHWYCSVPSETQPNRAYLHMATSEGLIKNHWTHKFSAKSIFESLGEAGNTWKIYAQKSEGTKQPLTMAQFNIPYLQENTQNIAFFDEFISDCAAGTLPNYTFIEPAWGEHGNSMHPNYNVAEGEAILKVVYEAIRNSPAWQRTLFIITFDEHGGCYDHVPPPEGAAPPDGISAANGFDFTRFGVRVPTILVSPFIEAGTVHRVPERKGATSTPFDHTSILKTIERRFGLAPLTHRDAAAPDIGDVFTREVARTDNPLADVTPPTAMTPAFAQKARKISDLVKAHTEWANHTLHDPNDPQWHWKRRWHEEDWRDDYHDDQSALRWVHQRYDRWRQYHDEPNRRGNR